MGRKILLFHNVILFYVGIVICTRTSKKIYFDVDGNSPCFRRFNATHQIGCTSEENGNVGVVHYVKDDSDFDWVVNNGPHHPYVVLLGSLEFNLKNVTLLKNSGRVNGIMVIHVVENETLTPFPEEGFSPDSSCPNDGYGLYNDDSEFGHCKTVAWNHNGTNLMYQDFNIPIFVLTNQTEVDFLINDCYEKFNKPTENGTARDYPLCAAELKDRMSGAKDSPTCMRRTNVATNLNPDTYCDPLGDKNVAATIKEVNSSEPYPNNSVIIAAARLDSFSLFENIYPSADNHVTGIVGLLAAAEALGKMKPAIKSKTGSKDILFAFFNGEAFDYIGSSRMIYEMEKGDFPAKKRGNPNELTLHKITLDHLSHFIEVNQLGYRDKDSLWIHSDPHSRQSGNISAEIDKMISTIKRISSDVGVKMDSVGSKQPLPPASVQRFLMKKTIPSIVITDHEGHYTNKYYNSRFDIAREINATTPSSNESDAYDIISEQARMLTKVSTSLAGFLFELSTGDPPPDVLEADVNQVNHMLHCFLVTRKCELFRQILPASDMKALGSLYLGDTVNVTEESNCKKSDDKDFVYQYVWMQGPKVANSTTRKGICKKTTANTSLAKSPAFDITDYDWNSGKYSTWTESSWNTISVRIFLVPSPRMQTTILSCGVILLLLSLLLVYGCNKKADILFSKNSVY
ncbi:hypothetical protein KUTeg_006134 [Tegillarca granosa]|uniref:Nicastrin n=1 Tax=Tegillarca granosa TaxID=220873 RepID=A0ABQ9FIK4_TEGGR|nr:hypothetical protein KUTeg_006134 [Tegillarca granosa]